MVVATPTSVLDVTSDPAEGSRSRLRPTAGRYPSRVTSALAAGLHLISVVLPILFYVKRAQSSRTSRGRSPRGRASFADSMAGLLSLGVYGAGFGVSSVSSKPFDWYMSNPVFWTKMGLIGLLVIFEIPVQRFLLPLQIETHESSPSISDPNGFGARLFNWCGVVVTCSVISGCRIHGARRRFFAHGVRLSGDDVACAVEQLFDEVHGVPFEVHETCRPRPPVRHERLWSEREARSGQ